MKVVGYIKNTSMDKMSAVQYYRGFLPLREVHRHDNQIEAYILDGESLAATIEKEGPVEFATDIDVFHWSRMSHGDCEAFVEEIHRRGAKFVIDSDDDLTEEFKLVTGHGEAFKNVLAHADYVTCTTPALAAHFGQWTQRSPVVLRNCIDVDWFAETASKAQRVVPGLTIGFTGSPTHWGDWYIPAVPLQRIARDFDIVPLLHGEMPRYMRFVASEEQLVVLGGVVYSLYPILLKQFDIVLCAVDPDDEFNSGKSAVKALECMAVGAIPICSRFDPYIELAEAGAPIVLVEENTRDAWYEAMRSLIEGEECRLQLRAAGADWVRENRDMCRDGYKRWEDFYRSIV